MRTAPGADRSVLVIGDSRIAIGFSAAIATHASGIRFVNAGVPGSTPRCWRIFARALDPGRHRFRAVVIPVDTYADDDGALGAADAWDHIADLRYVLFHLRPADIVWFTQSVKYEPNRRDALEWMLLPGTLMRNDVQALLADPRARFAAIAEARRADELFAGRRETLAGLRADFKHDRLVLPPGVSDDEREKIQQNVLRIPAPSTTVS